MNEGVGKSKMCLPMYDAGSFPNLVAMLPVFIVNQVMIEKKKKIKNKL